MDQSPNTKEEASSLDRKQANKPYLQPVLTRWGSLRDMTMAVGGSGKPDGGRAYARYTGRGGLYVLGKPRP